MEEWHELIERCENPRRTVEVGVVGKYVALADTYKSLNESLHHGGIAHRTEVKLTFIDSEKLTDCDASLSGLDAILVPGGFGERGVEGKIDAIRWARENKVPFFGICLGMQLAVVEFARHVLGLADAHSREFAEEADNHVIELMNEQHEVVDMGGTMRLGGYPCALRPGSRAARIYGSESISERHRHRYEVNPAFFEKLEAQGLLITGRSPDGRLAEMVELAEHPYFVACQFHPEFKSRPLQPHPLFISFIRAALLHQSERAAVVAATPSPPAAEA
jgi:CTP synthase